MRISDWSSDVCSSDLPITGSAHFRTPVEKGIEIIEGLRGHTTGYAVPQYVIDAPNGGGKIPLLPDSIVGRDGDDLLLRNFEGGVYRYPDPGGHIGAGTIGAGKKRRSPSEAPPCREIGRGPGGG